MAAIDDRIARLLSVAGPRPGMEALRLVLRPVQRHGSPEELKELASALLRQPVPEGVVLGLETLDRAQPGQSMRPDEDLETIRQRARVLGAGRVCGRVLGQAIPLASEEIHGDLIVLCALAGGSSALECLLRHLRAGDRWASLAARVLLLRAIKLEQRNSGDRMHLQSALADALDAWPEHQCREILLATTILASGARGRLARTIKRSEAPGVVALCRLVREAREDIVRIRLPRLIGVRALARPAVDALEDAGSGQLDMALGAGGHLLRSPKRTRRLARSRIGPRLAGRLSRRLPVCETAARSMPSLLVGCLRNANRLVRRLAVMASHPDQLTSVLATAELVHRVPGEARESALAEIAGAPGLPVSAGLASACSEQPFATAAFGSLAAFEEALGSKPPWWCAACALGHLSARADALASLLRRRLVRGSSHEIECVLEVIARRRLVGQFEPDLIALVECTSPDRDPVLAGRALRLLARGRTGRSARSIVRALASPHPQLQAAGLEAATDSQATPAVRAGCALVDGALLERLAHASHWRVRAGALRALRARSQGLCTQVLEDLLLDESPGHRMSGLDAARATGDPSLRASVLRLMEQEQQQDVIMRGRAVLRFLEARRCVAPPKLEEVAG